MKCLIRAARTCDVLVKNRNDKGVRIPRPVSKSSCYCSHSLQQGTSDEKASFGFPIHREEFRNNFKCSPEKVIELLEPLMIKERSEKISRIVQDRTFSVIPVVEGLYDTGNIAAVCRTAEGLGFGSVHSIVGDGSYTQSARTSAGSHKWLFNQSWPDTEQCLLGAKDAGYNVVVTDLEAAVSLEEVDWTKKTVLVLGNEHAGITQTAKSLADQRVIIPMHGFVESFNISVAAGMILKHACDVRKKTLGRQGDLSEEEQILLQAVFYTKHIGSRSKQIISGLLEREEKAISKAL